jgi:hypothetical protein
MFDGSHLRFRFNGKDKIEDKREADLPSRMDSTKNDLKEALESESLSSYWDGRELPPKLRGDILRRLAPILELWPETLLDKSDAILNREAMEDVIRPNLGYKARPLDGVWATPPYFHNGSVPNLDQVLSPASRRDVKFYLGTRRFDPVKVGYKTEEFYGAFLMDTTISGNRNTGHEFRNLTLEEFEKALDDGKLHFDPDNPPSVDDRWDIVLGKDVSALSPQARWTAERDRTRQILDEVRNGTNEIVRNRKFRGVRGLLGPEFTPQERRALIEYLKSL